MWYEDISYASPRVDVSPEGLVYEGQVVAPGSQIRFKGRRGIYLYAAVSTNTETGASWIECREYEGRKTDIHGTKAGKWRAFPLAEFKQPVLPKKPRRRRAKRTTTVSS